MKKKEFTNNKLFTFFKSSTVARCRLAYCVFQAKEQVSALRDKLSLMNINRYRVVCWRKLLAKIFITTLLLNALKRM